LGPDATIFNPQFPVKYVHSTLLVDFIFPLRQHRPFSLSQHWLPFIIDFLLIKTLTNTTHSCPYVTAVGATKVYPGHSVFESQPESAANDLAGAPYRSAYSSGGGFSNVYNTPDYQKNAVAT
jgi:hypothetical protein